MRSEAQEVTVLNAESQKPLLGVLISSKEPKTTTLTNESGKASIASYSSTKALSFSLQGYQSQNQTWEQLQAANFSVYLIPSRFTLPIDSFIPLMGCG